MTSVPPLYEWHLAHKTSLSRDISRVKSWRKGEIKEKYDGNRTGNGSWKQPSRRQQLTKRRVIKLMMQLEIQRGKMFRN